MNLALQKLFVVLALVSLPFWGQSQSVDLLTYQNSEINYDFTSRPNSPSLPGAFQPDNGTVELISNGNWEYTVTYTPDEGFIGTDHFRIIRWVIDPIPAFRTVDVNVTVAPALIHAYHDYAVTYSNQPIVVDVLANDISSNGVKVLQAVPAINHGVATFNSTTGLISFTPTPGFKGTAHFNYALCNGVGDCDDGTVSITVMEETPTTEDEVVKVFVKKNETQFILVPDNYSIVQDPQNGVFDPGADVPEYTPAENYSGTDAIIFTDGNHNLTFDIEVLDLETNSFAFDDRAFTTTNSPVDIPVLENDMALTGCSLDLEIAPEHGTVVESGDEYVYTPDEDFVGVDRFTYSSNICGSGAAREEATVTVFISNFAPDRTTFEMATPKNTPMIIGYNVPVSTFSFTVTSQGTLGVTEFLEGEVDTEINGVPIQGNNILIYTPYADVTEGLDEIEITYCLNDPDGNGCFVSKQVKIWMTILDVGDNGEPVCIGDCIWAGDTNADGIVNMNDLLPIGRSMGEIGTERAGATFDLWYGQYGEDWGSLFGGSDVELDIKHIDADGNSIVTAEDTTAIRAFYGRTHNMVPSIMPYAPYEFIMEGPLFITPGDYVEFSISVGLPETPAEDLYGFVFPFNYNPDVVVPNSLQINWHDDNFMAYDSPVIFMDHNDLSGRFEAGYTRTSGLVASGHGELGTLGIVIEDLQGFRTDEEEIILEFGGQTGSSLDQTGNYNSVYVRPFQIRLILNQEDNAETNELRDELLKTYPNPTNQYLSVHLNGQQEFEQITLRSLTGQVVQYQNNLRTNHTTLDVSKLTSGIYILSVANEKGVLNRKIEVVR